MEEDLEPGFAWMVMATEEGATDRMHEGNLWLVLSVFDDDRVDSCVAFALPFFAGAILISSLSLFL